MQISEVRTIQAEGKANAKALRQECAWQVYVEHSEQWGQWLEMRSEMVGAMDTTLTSTLNEGEDTRGL